MNANATVVVEMENGPGINSVSITRICWFQDAGAILFIHANGSERLIPMSRIVALETSGNAPGIEIMAPCAAVRP